MMGVCVYRKRNLALLLFTSVLHVLTLANEVDLPKEGQERLDVKTLMSPDKSHQEKWTLANQGDLLTPDQCRELHQLLSSQESDDWYYALTALVAAGDKSSVDPISQQLMSSENRYFALALGLLGDKEAIPTLKRIAARTSREHVRESAHMALRMLGAVREVSPSPPAPTSGPVQLFLSASETNITAGETFTLIATVKNMKSETLHVDGSDSFFLKFLEVSSVGGHYVLPIRQYFDYEPSAKSFPEVPPHGEITIKERCSVNVENITHSGWADVMASRPVYVLKGGAAGSWAFDVAPYLPAEDFELDLVVVYNPRRSGDVMERFKLNAPMIRSRLVSNRLRLRIGDKEEAK